MKNASEKYVHSIEELGRLYDFLNKEFFESVLTKPVITIQDDPSNSSLGWFVPYKIWKGDNCESEPEINMTATHTLEQIDRIMPWGELEELVRPHYYAGVRGNKPYDLELMLRIHLLQNLYTLSDEGTRNEVVDSRAFSDFCGVESSNQIPDGDTIGRFRNLLIENGIHEKFFALVVKTLTDRGLILKKGTIVDSTIIAAPSSTKNK